MGRPLFLVNTAFPTALFLRGTEAGRNEKRDPQRTVAAFPVMIGGGLQLRIILRSVLQG